MRRPSVSNASASLRTTIHSKSAMLWTNPRSFGVPFRNDDSRK